MQEAAISINGTRLSDAESEIIRVSVEAFAVILAEAIEGEDEELKRVLNERYLQAMAGVQRLLHSDALRTQ
jgi:hypothetical protein